MQQRAELARTHQLNNEKNMISIVTTLYYSELYVKSFYERIRETVLKITPDYEIIFVNDGYTDNALILAAEIVNRDSNVKLIELSRNFGHHKAIMTGLAHAKGEYVFLIDVDLEEEPELLSTFWEEMNKSTGVDVVYGIQEYRKGDFAEKITGKIFYKSFNYFSDIKVPENFITARLMTFDYCQALLGFKEQELFLGGLWMAAGFNQRGVYVKKHATSPSSYTFGKRLRLFLNSVTSFSDAPLLAVFNLGIVITSTSFLFALYWIIRKVVFGNYLEGWTTLMVSIWFLSGIIIFCLGLVGLYVARIFMEVKNRPYTIIKKIHRNESGRDC